MTRRNLELIALSDRPDHHSCPPLPEGCEEVRLGERVSALVGERPAEPKRSQSKLRRRKTFGAAALLRQQRLESILTYGTLLPFAPGTPRPDNLAHMAAANADTIARGHDQLRGRVQYQVVVSWSASEAPAHFGISPQATAALQSRLREAISDCLVEVTDDAIALPCRSDDVANIVILVDTTQIQALERALEDVDALWTEGLRIRLLGPGPAVSFARAQISHVTASAVRDAVALLALAPDTPITPHALSQMRKAALRRAHEPDAPGPDEIERATAIAALCSALAVRPDTIDDVPMITLHRDGPPLKVWARTSLGEVA